MEPAHSGGHAGREIAPAGRVVSRSRRIADGSIRGFLDDRDPPHVCWASRDGLEIAGTGAAARVTASGPDRFETVQSAATDLFEEVEHEGAAVTRPRLFGGFAFDAVGGESTDAVWDGFPAASFALPELQYVSDDDAEWLCATAYSDTASVSDLEARLDRAVDRLRESTATERQPFEPPGVTQTTVQPDRDTWRRTVEDALDRIEAEEMRKLVLATAMDVDLERAIDVPGILGRFRETYPDCYRILVRPADEAAFFGPPPEQLVKLQDGEVRTEALAGSIGRGETPAADEERADALRSDRKRQHEQRLVVDAIADELAAFGSVTEHEQSVRKLATIQHLRTPITAQLDDSTHVLDLVEALHPTPAVGGLPRDAAMAAIRATEPFDRGWYAAPVGWIDSAGDGEFTVAIRTGVARGDRVRLFAGNGIVADSDPDAEWDEIKPKFRPVLDELA